MEHISDLNGYDHILFLTALCGVWPANRWKTILIIVTAFTVAHSLSLLGATLKWIDVSTPWIEFLIPLTILLTCISHFISQPGSDRISLRIHFLLAFVFGLIHGLGFSFLLKHMLGSSQDIVLPLLYFNLGIELGQIIIIVLILLISVIIKKAFHITNEKWQFFLSSATFGIALLMTIERFSQLILSL